MRVLREHEFFLIAPHPRLSVAKWSEQGQFFKQIPTWKFAHSNAHLYIAVFGIGGRAEFVYKRGGTIYLSELEQNNHVIHQQIRSYMKAGMSPEDAIGLAEL
jgi:hypothetical protein